MIQRFSKPDRYFARCGHLDAAVTGHAIDGAPPFLRGLRVLFATDMHVLPRTTRAELDGLVDLMAGTQPDLLLLGGDYSDSASDCVRFFEALAGHSFPLGCFGVIGNNDAEAWEGNLRELRRIMSRAGCKLLVNQAVEIPCHGGTLCVGGIDEYRYGHPTAKSLWRGRASGERYRILLSHYPVLTEDQPDLMLCGHTHGGQFNLLGLTPYVIGFERLTKPHRPTMAISGLHDLGDMKLLVSKGIGASRLQLRVGVRPEINLLTFT